MPIEVIIAIGNRFIFQTFYSLFYLGTLEGLVRLIVNKDANITLDDYELMAKRVVQYRNLPKDKADKVLEIFREMAVLIGCGKPGDKISVEEAIK